MKPVSYEDNPQIFDVFRRAKPEVSFQHLEELLTDASTRHGRENFIVGVASVVIADGSLVLALAKKSYWSKRDESLIVQVKLFGGKREESEACIEALNRELKEELVSLNLQHIDCEQSYLFDPINDLSKVEFLDRPRPLVVHEGIFQGKPGRPEASGYWALLGIIYCSRISGAFVAPASEVPGLLMLDVKHFLELPNLVKVSELLAKGASVIVQPDCSLGDDDFIELGPTLQILREKGDLRRSLIEEASLNVGVYDKQ